MGDENVYIYNARLYKVAWVSRLRMAECWNPALVNSCSEKGLPVRSANQLIDLYVINIFLTYHI
jgi:hypothetical protein